MPYQPRFWRTCSRSSCPVLGSSRRTNNSSHCTRTMRPIQRRVIVGGFDFDAAVQMHDALALLVIAKGSTCSGRRNVSPPQTWRRPGVLWCRRYAFLPSVLSSDLGRLGFLQTLEPESPQRRFLCVADAGLDFARAIWILQATGDTVSLAQEEFGWFQANGRSVIFRAEPPESPQELNEGANLGEIVFRGASRSKCMTSFRIRRMSSMSTTNMFRSIRSPNRCQFFGSCRNRRISLCTNWLARPRSLLPVVEFAVQRAANTRL